MTEETTDIQSPRFYYIYNYLLLRTRHEWTGGCVSDTRDEVMKAFEEWAASVK